MDEKDIELVVLGRESETFQMQNEEYLTLYDEMRTSKDKFSELFE